MVLEINTKKGLGKTFIMEKKGNHVIVYLGEKRNYDVAELFEIAEKIENGKFKMNYPDASIGVSFSGRRG